jgi:hypothetical protein
MPTPTGLPKVGEVWELREKLPPTWEETRLRVVVLSRGSGSYWSLRVSDGSPDNRRLWVDASYYFNRGMLVYIGDAGPNTRKKLGLS